MLNIFKKKKRILVAVGIIILILIGIGGKIVMDKQIQSKQRQELALKDERVIAQKIKDNFSGVEEITFYSTVQLSAEPGGYTTNFSVKYSWSNLLSKQAREATKDINYDKLGNAEELDDGDIASSAFGALYNKDAQIYDTHYGKTEAPIKVIYPNGKEENL